MKKVYIFLVVCFIFLCFSCSPKPIKDLQPVKFQDVSSGQKIVLISKLDMDPDAFSDYDVIKETKQNIDSNLANKLKHINVAFKLNPIDISLNAKQKYYYKAGSKIQVDCLATIEQIEIADTGWAIDKINVNFYNINQRSHNEQTFNTTNKEVEETSSKLFDFLKSSLTS